MTSPWWQDAIIYAADVEHFCDGDGDGIGDFIGLTAQLPYLTELGITCVWLLPFHPSANRDNGYDVIDYYQVAPQFGGLGRFIDFVHAAGEHGIRVVLDLVAHHTSDQHPWFQAARHDERSRYRDYYIWAHHPPPAGAGEGSMFPGAEATVWTYDTVARAYYHHRFYSFEPDLNLANDAVRAEIDQIINFWTSFGIAGFRIDAASHLVEHPNGFGKDLDPHDILRTMYKTAKRHASECLMMGEVDETPDRLRTFFDGTQLDGVLNFLLNNYIILALAEERAEPIRRAQAMLPQRPPGGQWVNFLRNLDEADLERLSPNEMERTAAALAPQPSMRIYGRGLRRRLAPMLKGDPRRIALAFSLLFSLPGAPLFVYGDEIGMGEDLSQPERNSARMPMQWTAGRNAGFSTARKSALDRAPIDKGPFGYKRINVEAQRGDPESLLSRIKALIQLRRGHSVIGHGAWSPLDTGSDAVLAHQYMSEKGPLLILHNLSGKAARTEVALDRASAETLQPLFGGDVPRATDGRLRLDLEPYGLRWLGPKT